MRPKQLQSCAGRGADGGDALGGVAAAAAESSGEASDCGGDVGKPVKSGGIAARAAASGEDGREEEEARSDRPRAASLTDIVRRSMAAEVSCLVLGLTSAADPDGCCCGTQATSSALSEPPWEASCIRGGADG